MRENTVLRVSRLVRETAGFLLPLNEVGIDAEVARVEFDVDLRNTPGDSNLSGVVVLVTEAVSSAEALESVGRKYRGAAAIILGPESHSHLDYQAGERLGEVDEPETRTATGPLLLERSATVTWSEVLVHLRQLGEGASNSLAWPDVDDLSSLAAVIADLTGASITIEDPASRVLAYSAQGDEIDEIRKATILSGAIPQWRIEELETSGFLPAIRESTDVVERPATSSEPARSVIALRSDGELLGTIWAACPESIRPEELRPVLRDAATAALPVMLRTLRRSPFEKRIRGEALQSILRGASDLGPAATLLSLPFAGQYAAIAFADVPAPQEALLRFYLRAAFADAVFAHDAKSPAGPGRDGRGSSLAALVQTDGDVDEEEIKEQVLESLGRTLSSAEPIVFGVGHTVGRLDHVHESWTEAGYVVDAALARMRLSESDPDGWGYGDLEEDGSVIGAIAADLPAELVSLEVADALAEVDPRITAPARILAHHDEIHQGYLLDTLSVYFETVGNSAEASRRLHVHSNSLRYRLGRIEELTGLSPTDRAQRLWLELSLLCLERAEL